MSSAIASHLLEAAGPPTRYCVPMSSPERSKLSLPIALLVGILTAAVYALYSWYQWHRLEMWSWDLGIFSQLAKAYSTFSAPIVNIKGHGFNLLGDHFHPILVVTGPLWKLWPSPVMLLILQAVLFGLSAIPLTRLAVDKLSVPVGTALGLAYGLSWGLQSAVMSQFHEIAFAVPIIAFGLTAYLRGRLLASALWMGALVFVKEDLGVTVALFGLIILVRHWKEPGARKTGSLLALWGIAWVFLATRVILPALNPADQYDYADKLGSLADLFTPADKWHTVGLLILAAGVIGLRSPLTVLMLPTLAWRFAGEVERYWVWRWHYNATLMPIAIAALIEAAILWPKLRTWAVAATVASTAILTTQLPLLKLFDADWREPSPRWEAAQRAIESIPEGSSVVSDNPLLVYYVPRAEVYWVDGSAPEPDFVSLNEEGNWPNWSNGRTPAGYAEQQHGGAYETHFHEEGFIIVRRR